VRIDYTISKILRKLELASRMVAWSVELSEFGIKYEPRGAIKAQSLADFIIQLPAITQQEVWTLHVDCSSYKKGSGAGIVLKGPKNFQVEMALKLEFKTSNNQAEYEALIAGLLLARDIRIDNVICKSDFQLSRSYSRRILGKRSIVNEILS